MYCTNIKLHMINTVGKDVPNITLIFILSVLRSSSKYPFFQIYLTTLIPGITPGITVNHI